MAPEQQQALAQHTDTTCTYSTSTRTRTHKHRHAHTPVDKSLMKRLVTLSPSKCGRTFSGTLSPMQVPRCPHASPSSQSLARAHTDPMLQPAQPVTPFFPPPQSTSDSYPSRTPFVTPPPQLSGALLAAGGSTAQDRGMGREHGRDWSRSGQASTAKSSGSCTMSRDL
jgi:hypothetical protein